MGAGIVCVDLQPGDEIQLRNRGCVRPWWLNLAYQAVIVPADHVMTRGMFRGLPARVTSTPAR
jgi:hypothetical protein